MPARLCRPFARLGGRTALIAALGERRRRLVVAELDQRVLGLDRPLEPRTEARLERQLARIAANERDRYRAVVAERKARAREDRVDLGDRRPAPPRERAAADRVPHLHPQGLEGAHRFTARPHRADLELGVPGDGDPHEAADHVGEMGWLAALLALLRDAELTDQRPDRWDG